MGLNRQPAETPAVAGVSSENAFSDRRVWMREEYDCLRAAAATLLAIPYEETLDTTQPAETPGPDVCELADGRLVEHRSTWKAEWQEWAQRRGLQMVWIPYTDADDSSQHIPLDEDSDWRDYLENVTPGEWLAIIRSRTAGKDSVKHVVVMRGAEIVHDPKPGVYGPVYLVGGYVFAPLTWTVPFHHKRTQQRSLPASLGSSPVSERGEG